MLGTGNARLARTDSAFFLDEAYYERELRRKCILATFWREERLPLINSPEKQAITWP